MARQHGRKGRLYMAVAAAGTAAPVPFISQFSIDLDVPQEEVTAFEDDNKVYLSGLPDAKGSFAGFFDDATRQMAAAAVDGTSRKFYWYPDRTVNTIYYFGTANWSTSQSFNVGGASAISGSWTAAGPCAWSGIS